MKRNKSNFKASINYKGQDLVTRLDCVVPHMQTVLDSMGLGHVDLRQREDEPKRFVLGGASVELLSPNQLLRVYFEDDTPKKLKYFPVGYAVRSELPGQVGDAYLSYGRLVDMLGTIGHEVFGHLLSPELPSKLDEEGKAFAFEAAVNQTLQRENIANSNKPFDLFRSRVHNKKEWPNHHVAHKFVVYMISLGYEPMKIYRDFCDRSLWVPEYFVKETLSEK